MLAHSKSGVYSMETSSKNFWLTNGHNILSSNISMTLHDPECQSRCCLTGFEKSMQIPATNYNNLEQLLSIEACNSVESIITPPTSENFMFSYTDCNDDQTPECRQTIDGIQADNRETDYSDFSHNKQAERKQYTHFCKSTAKHDQKSDCKGVLKRKRKRTVFSTEQIIAMEGVFKKRPYVSREERLVLTQKLNISEKAIKVWFQNRRRVTEKREKDQSESCHSDSTVEEIYDDYTARLDYIEAQINQTLDEHGFVTLDDNIISDLVNVIDTVLSQSIDYNNSLEHCKDISQNENYLMYEPISPESLPDENRKIEDISKWIPLKPEESLQRLMDIQNLIIYR